MLHRTSNHWVRVAAGGLIWTTILCVGCWYALQPNRKSDDGETALHQVGQFLLGPERLVELEFDTPQLVGRGDPVFFERDGASVRIGEVVQVESRDSVEMKPVKTSRAYVRFYPTAPDFGADARLSYHETPGEIGWVLQMMFPEHMRQKVGQMISKAYLDHHEEIMLNLQPVIEAAAREAIPVIEEDLRLAFATRKQRWQGIANRYRDEIVEGELVPLVEHVVWPIVREESEPLVEDLGQEIWEEASLFRFGWRVLYDATPLPKRDLTKKEFERFVSEQALPIVQRRTDDLVALQERILSRVASDMQVRQVVGESLMKIADDPDVQRLVLEIIEEVFIRNERLANVFKKHWNSQRTKEALALTGKRLEPTVAAIGEELFGNPHTQITPEFARVMRFKVLRKDARWFVLSDPGNPEDPGSASKGADPIRLRVVPGNAATQNPFYIERNLPPRPRLFNQDESER